MLLVPVCARGLQIPRDAQVTCRASLLEQALEHSPMEKGWIWGLFLPRLHESCFQAGVNEELPELHRFLLSLSVVFCCLKEDLLSTCCMN